MKKLTTFLIILLIALTGYALASSFKPYSYPFIGRWQPAEDSRLIDEHGFQDIQNLRKDGKRLKGVSGHSKINTTQLTTTYRYSANAFHFRKDNPAESHVLVLAVSTGVDAEGVIWNNKTAIPAQGDFAGTLEHTDASGAGLGRFSMAPQGNMIYCNGEETLIWGGAEIKPYAFLTSVSTVTGVAFNSPKDYTDQIQNSRQDDDELATIGGGMDGYCKLLMHMDGTTTEFADATGVHTPVANGNAVTDTTQKKFGPKSGYFDGTGDYIEIQDHADWDFDAGDFTMDFWFRHSIAAFTTTESVYFYEQFVDANNYIYFWYLYNHTFRLYSEEGGGNQIWLTFHTKELLPDQDYHIALIRGWEGDNEKFVVTVNGSALSIDTDTDPMANVASSAEFGGNVSAARYWVNGWMDEIRVSKGIARWTSNFTPPVREYRSASNHWVVGSPRPLQAAKFYLKHPNQVTGTITAEEWNGSSWTSLTITDNTSGLSTSGSITWPSTVDSSKPIYLQGQYLYWYQFHLSTGEADIYQVTADAPMQKITNIWDGSDRIPIQFQVYDGAVWEDYSLEVLEEALVDYETNPIAAELDDLANTEYVYAGFHERMTGIKFNLAAGHENPNAASASVYYWNGDTWEGCSSIVDGTNIGGISLSKSGYIQWTSPNKDEEFTQVLFGQSIQKSQTVPGRLARDPGKRKDEPGWSIIRIDPIPGKSKITGAAFPEFPLYYYKFMWSAVLGTNVLVDTVVGIPAQERIKGYAFPVMFQGRSFLFSEDAEDKNKSIYSAFNAPDVWNGFDVGELYFGGDEKLTAAASLYNLYRTTGFHQLLITKQNETYRLFGDGPDNWQVQQMSENVGCIAPLSMAACELSEIEEGQRNVAIWQAEHGVVMSDGATIRTISDDIKCYWDRNDSKLIPVARLDDSVGWYDPTLRSYKLLITSGTGETAHNTELEYSLEYQEWTKLYREVTTTSEGPNPLQVGFMVKDTVGKAYSYGVTDLGYMYRLENGLTWDGTAISEYIWTKDLMLDDEWPLMRHTAIQYFRLLYAQKATTGETISIAHYCDGILTAGGTWDLPDSIDPGTHEYQTDQCLLGPCLYHSFKISGDFDAIYDGMELIGLGLYYEPYLQIRE